MKRISKAAYGVLGLATSMTAQAAYAQVSSSEDQVNRPSDIIVTAQRREQNLQDVPITVNILGSEAISNYSVKDLKGAITRIPGLELRRSNEQDILVLRGLGNFGSTNFGFDTPIGIFVDGVYHGRTNQLRFGFLDLERIEVLKGPQSILFGMNTPIGAISIVSKKPGKELGAEFQATGDFKYNNYELRGAVNLPVTENLAIRVAGLKTFEDGYVFNTFLDRKEGGSDNFTWRATALWEATDALTVTAKIEGGTAKRNALGIYPITPTNNAALQARILAADPDATFSPDDLLVSQFPSALNSRTIEPVLTIDYDMGPVSLQSITAYSDFRSRTLSTLTGIPINYGGTDGLEKFNQFSQELRFSSNGDSSFEYQGGVFFQRSKLFNTRPLTFIFSNFAPPSTIGPQTYLSNIHQTYETYAAFAQGTVKFGDNFKAIGGLRLTHERKRGRSFIDWITPGGNREDQVLTPGTPEFDDANFVFNTVFGIFRSQQRAKYRSTFLIPDVKLQWDPTDQLMFYASVGQGRKAGGFNDRDNKIAGFQFGPEKAVNYELGARLNLADGRALINVALFHTDFTDLQVSLFDLATNDFIVGNAAEALSEGIDADIRVRFGGFGLDGGFTWLNRNRYGEFLAPCRPTAANVATCVPQPDGGGIQDRSNEQLGNSNFTATAGADFTAPITESLTFDVRGDLRYASSLAVSPNNLLRIEPVTFIDGRIGLTYNDNLSFHVVGQNLTDRRHVSQTTTFLVPGQISGPISAPRTIAFQVGYKF